MGYCEHLEYVTADTFPRYLDNLIGGIVSRWPVGRECEHRDMSVLGCTDLASELVSSTRLTRLGIVSARCGCPGRDQKGKQSDSP